MSDILLGRAVGDELIQGDLAVVVQVHRFEDLGDVRLRRLAADGRRVAHQLVDRVGHLKAAIGSGPCSINFTDP